jgi:hypothetical protein
LLRAARSWHRPAYFIATARLPKRGQGKRS